jgi:hypothetical protein
MPKVEQTWKANQTFPNGQTLLGQITFGPASGLVEIHIDRSNIPNGGVLEVNVEARPVGQSQWQPQFGVKVIMDGTPGKDGTFVTKTWQPFALAVQSEIRAVANVINGPFAFDAKAVASW